MELLYFFSPLLLCTSKSLRWIRDCSPWCEGKRGQSFRGWPEIAAAVWGWKLQNIPCLKWEAQEMIGIMVYHRTYSRPLPLMDSERVLLQHITMRILVNSTKPQIMCMVKVQETLQSWQIEYGLGRTGLVTETSWLMKIGTKMQVCDRIENPVSVMKAVFTTCWSTDATCSTILSVSLYTHNWIIVVSE